MSIPGSERKEGREDWFGEWGCTWRNIGDEPERRLGRVSSVDAVSSVIDPQSESQASKVEDRSRTAASASWMSKLHDAQCPAVVVADVEA